MGETDALDKARALARQGDVPGAVRGLLKVGAFEEAAGVLSNAGRFADAAHLLMDALGVGPALVGGLDAERKGLAFRAAAFFAQAAEIETSVKLYLALGEQVRAADVLERSGDRPAAERIRAQMERGPGSAVGSNARADTLSRVAALRLEREGRYGEAFAAFMNLRQIGDAARVAELMKQYADAARLYEKCGRPFDAARSFVADGDAARSLDALCGVPREDPNYRVACVQAIGLAIALDVFDFRLDQFLSKFVSEGPRSEVEIEAFYSLGNVYTKRDFVESAIDVFTKILAVRPGYRGVEANLKRLRAEGRGSQMAYEAIVREDSSFRRQRTGREGLTDERPLPELPDLPDLTSPVQTMGQVPRPVRTVQTVPPRSPVARPAAQPAAPPQDPPDQLPPGTLVADRYSIDAKIGQGGMATIYRAKDLELGETVALKLFAQHTDTQALSRFKQEVTLSRQLAHPNIVRLYDIGSHAGFKFLTMELLEGSDLRAILDQGALDPNRAIKVLVDVCSGLAVAHESGIIHRDLKPENLFLTKDDAVKVMDFGIAKGNRASGLTVAGFIAGTPAYMSPEQINDFGAVTHLADLYALGVIAYELFTGSVPFDHAETMPLLMMHINAAPEPPRARAAHLPAELDDIILRLLEKEPRNRIQSCRDLASQLREIRVRQAATPRRG